MCPFPKGCRAAKISESVEGPTLKRRDPKRQHFFNSVDSFTEDFWALSFIDADWEALVRLLVDELEAEDWTKMAKVVRAAGAMGMKAGARTRPSVEEDARRYVEMRSQEKRMSQRTHQRFGWGYVGGPPLV